LQEIGVLPIPRASSSTASVVASEVAMPRITSTRAMTGTGFMKCMPMKRSGRPVAAARRVMEIDEVFDARMAAGARCNFQLPVRWALRSAMKGKPSLRADYTVRGRGENRLECFHRRLSVGSKDSVYRSGIKSRISKRF